MLGAALARPGEQVDLVLDAAKSIVDMIFWIPLRSAMGMWLDRGPSCFVGFGSATRTPLPTASSGVWVSNTVLMMCEMVADMASSASVARCTQRWRAGGVSIDVHCPENCLTLLTHRSRCKCVISLSCHCLAATFSLVSPSVCSGLFSSIDFGRAISASLHLVGSTYACRFPADLCRRQLGVLFVVALASQQRQRM